TGAVASQNVTEAPKGSLRMVGNHSQSAKAEGSLTARLTSRAGTKVGLSDPVVPYGRPIAQRIKATLGITGLSPPRVHIDRSEEHTSELQSRFDLVCRLLLEKKKQKHR